MNLRHLNTREKVLAAVILVVVIIGAYGYLRFQPYFNEINVLEQQKDNTLDRISTMEIPEEPREDIDAIMAQLADQEKALDAIEDNAAQIETQLAPLDSQELRVRISELARDSGIRIRVNETLRPPSLINNRGGSQSKAEVVDGEVIPPPTTDWITRMSPGSMFARPLQRLEIDSDYPSLRRFIYGLDSLPFQVTVVRLNIEKLDVPPLRGMSQLIKTELVLAL